MREEPQSHLRPGGVDWWRETELSPTSHQVNYLSSLLSITNLYGAPSRTNPNKHLLTVIELIYQAPEQCAHPQAPAQRATTLRGANNAPRPFEAPEQRATTLQGARTTRHSPSRRQNNAPQPFEAPEQRATTPQGARTTRHSPPGRQNNAPQPFEAPEQRVHPLLDT